MIHVAKLSEPRGEASGLVLVVMLQMCLECKASLLSYLRQARGSVEADRF